MKPQLFAIGLLALAVTLGIAAAARFEPVSAADHAEAPGAQADPAADIADVFTWHANGNLVVVVTYGATGMLPLYDAGVLYTVQIDDDDADNDADTSIEVRFGANASSQFGVQALNVPGATGPISGAVETTLPGGGGTMLYAGMFDDPFFFDLQGYLDTLATGTLSFDNSRDGFAGKNVMAIVLEMPLSAANTGTGDFRVWATTGRE